MADKKGKGGASGGSANTSKKNTTTQQGQGEQKKEKKTLNPTLAAINKEATRIQKAGGKTTEVKTVEVTKYKIDRKTATKQASEKIAGKK